MHTNAILYLLRIYIILALAAIPARVYDYPGLRRAARLSFDDT
jgi:hypothetical protein